MPSPKERNAEDAYFDREMCRFYCGADYVKDDIVDLKVLKHAFETVERTLGSTNWSMLRRPKFSGLE